MTTIDYYSYKSCQYGVELGFPHCGLAICRANTVKQKKTLPAARIRGLFALLLICSTNKQTEAKKGTGYLRGLSAFLGSLV
jgi:hypothetical protein